MAHIIADRVKETTTTTGTGALTLAGVEAGHRTFASQMSTSDTCFYCIDGGTEWEVGLGTYSGVNTLTRTTILTSSNSNSAVDFSAGTKLVFITHPASQIPYMASGSFAPTIIGDSTAGTGTYTEQIGLYYRTGSLCYIQIRVTITNHTGTGGMRITGLPFTSTNSQQMLNIRSDGLTFTNQLVATVVASTTQVAIQYIATGASPSGIAMDTACSIVVSGYYSIV